MGLPRPAASPVPSTSEWAMAPSDISTRIAFLRESGIRSSNVPPHRVTGTTYEHHQNRADLTQGILKKGYLDETDALARAWSVPCRAGCPVCRGRAYEGLAGDGQEKVRRQEGCPRRCPRVDQVVVGN